MCVQVPGAAVNVWPTCAVPEIVGTELFVGMMSKGRKKVQGRLSRWGDELARAALYEVAHSLLVRGKK